MLRLAACSGGAKKRTIYVQQAEVRYGHQHCDRGLGGLRSHVCNLAGGSFFRSPRTGDNVLLVIYSINFVLAALVSMRAHTIVVTL